MVNAPFQYRLDMIPNFWRVAAGGGEAMELRCAHPPKTTLPARFFSPEQFQGKNAMELCCAHFSTKLPLPRFFLLNESSSRAANRPGRCCKCPGSWQCWPWPPGPKAQRIRFDRSRGWTAGASQATRLAPGAFFFFQCLGGLSGGVSIFSLLGELVVGFSQF